MTSKNTNYIPPEHLIDKNTHTILISKHFKLFIKDDIQLEIERIGNNAHSCITYKVRVIFINNNDEYENYICKIMINNYNFIKDISIQTSNLNISPEVLYYNDEDKFIIYKYV